MTYGMVIKQVIDTEDWYSENVVELEFSKKQDIWDVYHALINTVAKQIQIACYEIDDVGQATVIEKLSYEWKNRMSDEYYKLMDLIT